MGHPAGEAITLNLSERGALIRTTQPVDVGETLNITLFLEDGRRIDLDGRVAHVIPQADASADIGIAFRNLTEEDKYQIQIQLQLLQRKP